MQFDDPKAGNSLNFRKLHVGLKEYLSSTARAKRFPLKKGKSTVIAERKQFWLILGHAITVNKSHRKLMWSDYQQPIFKGQFYALLSDVKSHDKVFKVVLSLFQPFLIHRN